MIEDSSSGLVRSVKVCEVGSPDLMLFQHAEDVLARSVAHSQDWIHKPDSQ